jgi:hypothetical protein
MAAHDHLGAQFGVGDTVHVPGHGPVTVESMNKRYFSGTTASGERLGQTGIGLAAGQGMRGGTPWRVERGAE